MLGRLQHAHSAAQLEPDERQHFEVKQPSFSNYLLTDTKRSEKRYNQRSRCVEPNRTLQSRFRIDFNLISAAFLIVLYLA